jgi:uncharacterized protein YecA (UPF0149 family)
MQMVFTPRRQRFEVTAMRYAASCRHDTKSSRAIYAHCRKRGRAAIADSIPSEHVGRNDPCPCGCTKKFKKCCMDKGARGKNGCTETTITTRR